MRWMRNFWTRVRREPAFAAIFIITLALGVGANAALLTALHGYYLAPLPYRDAGRLVNISQTLQGLGGMSMASYRDVLANTHEIKSGGLAGGGAATVLIGGHPRVVNAARFTPSMFRTLGVAPSLGYVMDAAAGRPDGPKQVVLSHSFWQSAYGGNPDVVGKNLNVDGRIYTIVGVMPAGFYFPDRARQIYLPLVVNPDANNFFSVQSWDFVARMAPGVSLGTLRAALHARAQAEIAKAKPAVRAYAKRSGYGLAPQALRANLIGNTGARLVLIELGAAFLLALAIAILANLVTVRALGHRHEKALKLALGAKRLTLWREALRETLPLAFAGGALAVAFAWVGTRLLLHYGFGGAGSAFSVQGYGWMILAAFLLAMLAGLLAALPAAFGSGARLLTRLAEGGHGTPTRRSRLFQRGLSVVQIALGVALLVNAALIGLAYHKLATRSPGFDTSQLVVAVLGLHGERFAKQADNVAFVRQFSDAAERLPGFQRVGITNATPFSNTLVSSSVNRPGAPKSEQVFPAFSFATAGYLRALGARLVAGRTFTSGEVTGDAKVAVVDTDLARALYGSPISALGHSLKTRGKVLQIIGVARSVRWFAHPLGSIRGTLWLPYSLLPASETKNGVYVLVRTRLPSAVAGRELKGLLERLAPTQAFRSIRPMSAFTANAYRGDQAPAVLVGLFSLIALILAAVGTYGTVAYLIRQRLGEFAVRQALGATPTRIGVLALTQGALIAALGIGIGIGGGFLLARALSGLIHGAGSTNALAYLAAAIVMALAALLATAIPARRARRADLTTLLRPQ